MADNIKIGGIYYDVKVSSDEATKKIDKLSGSVGNLNRLFGLFKVSVFIKGLKDIGTTISNITMKQTELIQTQNLFNKVMGSSIQKATEFRDNMQSKLGMDPQDVMKSMNAFKQLAETFGINEERSYLMSKNLTQLASDMTAYGYSFENAMKKLKSGLAGKIFCLAYKGLYAVTHLIAGKSKRIMA